MIDSLSYNLDQYRLRLKKEDLLHLLRRCLFGVGNNDLSAFKNDSLDQCIEKLLKQTNSTPMPIQEDSDVPDPLIEEGKTWVNAPYENDLINNRRELMLKMWWAGRLLNRDYSLTEKMTLFWHNHFVASMDVVKDSRYFYRYIAMLRSHSLGNFKALIKEGVTNVAMLVYLNGNTNERGNPNENFARELLELFTLGKGTGSNYTEEDVRMAARVLSGWKDDKEKIEPKFIPSLHDTEDKRFSSFFDNRIIVGRRGMEGRGEIDELIDMIFEKKETARFVCRNIYRWFVCSHIDENIEEKIINPLAEIFIANNFEIAPVLRKLLGSEHFFDFNFRGCIVKSPVDFLIGAMQQLDVVSTSNLNTNHIPWLQFSFYLGDLSMDIGNPPSVAGWPAFYQTPKFHQWWINSASLGFRTKLIKGLSASDGLIFNGPSIKFNFIHFTHQFSTPIHLDSLIDEYCVLLFAVEISSNTKNALKKLLLAGQKNEKSWDEMWSELSVHPNDLENRTSIESRLRLFFIKLLSLPEYQMM